MQEETRAALKAVLGVSARVRDGSLGDAAADTTSGGARRDGSTSKCKSDADAASTAVATTAAGGVSAPCPSSTSCTRDKVRVCVCAERTKIPRGNATIYCTTLQAHTLLCGC